MPGPSFQRPAPFSLRLTRSEREYLRAKAGGMPLGAYIRSVVLDDTAPSSGPKSPDRIAEWQRWPQLLGLLGTSERSMGMREIARLAEAGALPLSPEVEAEIRNAARDITEMKSLLMKALRTKER